MIPQGGDALNGKRNPAPVVYCLSHMDRRHILSKTRFLSGCQCPLKLWYDTHARELATPPDEETQALFATGHEVGALARQRWPGGTEVTAGFRDVRVAVEQTRELMADPAVPAIYEAAVVHRDVLTRVDVLVRVPGDAWDLVEVKSSTRAKDVFELDVAVQYWILRRAGLDVRAAGLLLLNRDYVYPGGELDLQRLFRFEDLTESCEGRLEEIRERVTAFKSVQARTTPPDIGIGDHCFDPYECPYYEHCSRDVKFPEHPIDMLPKLWGRRRNGLLALGVESVEQIPDDYELTENQARVRQCVVTGRPWVSGRLRAALESVQWPVHALDFETAMYAVPRYAGARPFDAVPFQFSCHRQDGPGAEPSHREFLAVSGDDPREPLAGALLEAVSAHGSILVYSGYEGRVIRDLARWVPTLADALQELLPRLEDLLRIVDNHYCHPDFGGSTSIKAVLPVLVPDMSYKGMAIADGRAAARAWMRMVECGDMLEHAELRRALRNYCRQDSLAMLKTREALLERA